MIRFPTFALFPFLIFLSIILVEMATDLYAPNMPSMMAYFGVAEYAVQLTISADLLGLAISGLFCGPLSDSYGRRPVLIVGIVVFTVAAVACIFAPTLWFLIAMRFIQGLGSGVALVVGASALKDRYSGETLSRVISILAMLLAVSPGVAPIIGGYIGVAIGWRGIFAVLAVAGLLVVLVLHRYFPETLAQTRRQPLRLGNVLMHYRRTFSQPVFISYTLILSLAVAIWWAEIANLPFLLIEQWGVPAQHYGFYFGSNIVFFMLGTLCNTIFVNKVGVERFLLIGLILKITSVALLIGAVAWGVASPWIIITYYPGTFGMGLFFGNVYAKALSPFTENVGIANAVLTLLQMICAAIAIQVVGSLYNGTAVPLASASFAWVVLTLLFYGLAKHYEKRALKADELTAAN